MSKIFLDIDGEGEGEFFLSHQNITHKKNLYRINSFFYMLLISYKNTYFFQKLLHHFMTEYS